MIAAWLFYGGRETLQSFGVPEQIIASGDETAMMRAARAVIPSDVIRWLRALPMSRRIGDYLFVHAGVRPGVPLDEQDPVDMRWIRREFLESEARSEEHTSELQSLMRISYAVFCLKKK